MLEGLPAIDWASLTHAYGPAGNVPKMIRALASPDPEKWVEAIDGLYNTLCHQMCTVWEATPAAIPFLIELLGYREVRCRGRILQFLGDTAAARSYLHAHGDMAHYAEKRKTQEWQNQLAVELEWVRRTREAIWNGLDVYLDLLTDLDKRIRIVVPYTLGLLVRYAGEQMPESIAQRDPYRLMAESMSRHFEEEPSELVRASLIFGLSRLAPHRPEIAGLLQGYLSDYHAGKPVKLSAALCLAEMSPLTKGGLQGGLNPEDPPLYPPLRKGGSEGLHPPPRKGGSGIPPAALDVLLEALKNAEETKHLFASDQPAMEDKHHPLYKAYRKAGMPFSEEAGTGYDPGDVGKDEDFKFPWVEGWPWVMIMKTLARPDADYQDRAVPLLTPFLDRVSEFACESVAVPILRLVFGDKKVTPATRRHDLTPAQAEVLRHLYDNLLLWATDSGNVTSAFEEFGLTHDRRDWTRLLEIEEKPLTDAEIEAILQRLLPAQQRLVPGQPLDRDAATVKYVNLRRIYTSAFLPHLKRYTDLEKLDLSCTQLGDADLVHLTGFPKLKCLLITTTEITDRGAETLGMLKALEDLNLCYTRITDAGLKALQGLKSLRSLAVVKTAVTAKGVEAFQKARPDCKVWK